MRQVPKRDEGVRPQLPIEALIGTDVIVFGVEGDEVMPEDVQDGVAYAVAFRQIVWVADEAGDWRLEGGVVNPRGRSRGAWSWRRDRCVTEGFDPGRSMALR
jgi:hypothetical protein